MKILLAVSFAALALAAPAAAATAPGRVAYPQTQTPEADDDASGGGSTALVPGGGLLVASGGPGATLTVRALRADGSLDGSFGQGGVATVTGLPLASGYGAFQVAQLLRRPDGRLLLVGSPGEQPFQLTTMVVVGLTASGALDPSFGDHGLARPSIQGSCGNCSPAALLPDGSLLLTGNTGAQSAAIAHDPNAPNTFTWAVAKLTPSGEPDPSFGGNGVLAVPDEPAHDAGGSAIAALADGRIAVLGWATRSNDPSQLVRLLPDGRLDPAFNGGAPLSVPLQTAFSMLVDPSGAVTALGFDGVARTTAAGALDLAFGTGGKAGVTAANGSTGQLARAADGTVVVYRSQSYEARPASQPAMVVTRLDAHGAAGTTNVPLAFGGGYASFFRAFHRIIPAPSLEQNSFRVSALVPRPDGSWLAIGGTSEIQGSGEGTGWSAGQLAVAALKPDFTPDPAYGGRATPAKVTLRSVAQHALSDYHLRAVAVRVTANAPGLVLIRVRDGHRRILAEGVEPVYAPGTRTVRVQIARDGMRILRHTRNIRVLLGARFRDVLTDEGVHNTIGLLR